MVDEKREGEDVRMGVWCSASGPQFSRSQT